MSELATVRGPVNDICKTAGSLVECTSDERTNEARTEICGGDPSCENLSPESGEPSQSRLTLFPVSKNTLTLVWLGRSVGALIPVSCTV